MKREQRGQKSVLIVGAGEAGVMIVKALLRHPERGLAPVGFLDDDPNKQDKAFEGVSVLGNLQALPDVVQALDIDEVIIALPSAPSQVLRRVMDLAREAKVSYKTLPSLHEILSGASLGVREVKLEDLLQRDSVKLSIDKIAHVIEGRTVLITGAGGSIGSELCRQVARFRPKRLILLGRGENSIYSIERELCRTFPALQLTPVIADVRNFNKLKYVFQRHQPQVVFHAAAHKHVPLMEANPDEAIVNNVRGTQNVAELALEYGVVAFVNISTDKAVNPTSVMGASKRVAEFVVADVARRAMPDQVFISVRFGNVLGSRGSVVPLFQEQIRLGGPITITHPDMVRYFMTIPEASQLVLQAACVGGNGEVYVLDMGKPVRIMDLAKDMIRLSGLEPDHDIKIKFTGMRPGEKLFEELLTAEDGTIASEFEKLLVARVEVPESNSLQQMLHELYGAAESYDGELIKACLATLLPQYTLSKAVMQVMPVAVHS